MRVQPRDATPLGEIPVERCTGRGMQRQEAAFLELRGANQQTISRHILELEVCASETRMPVTARSPKRV
jgi:hypothetical protein